MSAGWDEAVIRHLEAARGIYDDARVVRFLQNVISTVWKDNRARWSPDLHFDDTNTLGYQTSRNVNNCISSTFDLSYVASSVAAEVENGIPFLVAEDFRLRVIKAPIESGIQPNFYDDFDWTTSATRQGAAQRNSANYYPIRNAEWTLEYESDPRPTQKKRIERCRDLFLVWAASLDSDKTSSWLGLPRVGDVPWLGVVDIWTQVAAETDGDLDADDEPYDDPGDVD